GSSPRRAHRGTALACRGGRDYRPSRHQPGSGACRATPTSALAPACSCLALGVGYSLDQVVAALVGRDLAGQTLLDLDVELIGPGEVPRLVERGHDRADVGCLVPHLENGIDVAP